MAEVLERKKAYKKVRRKVRSNWGPKVKKPRGPQWFEGKRRGPEYYDDDGDPLEFSE